MKKHVELGIFDYLLVLVACTSSLFAMGESLSKHTLAGFLTIGSAASILIGFVLSRSLAGTKFKNYDGYIWTVLAFATAIFSRPLNNLLPEEGFPFMLFAGTWLSWMILLCGMVSWRDQTLLFLNLPCISIFALVGTFDTFAPATILFFVFLVCSSLLYARIHQRAMIRRAQTAGYSDPTLLDRDVWRWMAGPEWAFASAGVIVVLSLVFGPILRFSLQPVSGSVKMSLPQTTPTNPVAAALQNTELRVGQGPVNLTNDVVYRIKVKRPGYLRTAHYTEYQGNGWTRVRNGTFHSRLELSNVTVAEPDGWARAWENGVPLEPIQTPQELELVLKGPKNDSPAFPSPGPVVGFLADPRAEVVFSINGLVYRRGGNIDDETIRIRYLMANDSVEPGESLLPTSLAPVDQLFTRRDRLPTSVREFASNAAKGGRNDFEKATRIQNAIARTARYTLKPRALSPTSDAVEQFLMTTKVGYCDLFATSMVMCARSVGLRARYTVGYLVTDYKKDAEGFYSVKAKDAHAWAEIFFDGAGWVPFDATMGAQIVPDDESQDGNLPWHQQPWAPFAVGTVLTSLIVGSIVLWRLNPKERVSQVESHYRFGAVRIHQEFDRSMRKQTGVMRKFSQTTTEYVQALLPAIGPLGPEAMDVARRLEEACFSEDEYDAVQLKSLSESVKSLSRDLASLKRT